MPGSRLQARQAPAPAPIHAASQPAKPTHRLLRGYAFDPSLATRLETALVSKVRYRVPGETLQPGPCGEHVEAIDVNPASGCFYAPVNLDHPHILAQNGLAPSEGSPRPAETHRLRQGRPPLQPQRHARRRWPGADDE